jgi:hypothetical protein
MAKDVKNDAEIKGTDSFKENPANVAVKAGTVPKTNVEGAAPEKKAKVLIPDIIRGRMPIAVVYQVRFGEQRGGETKALATLFGTTVGKITDIKKNSTFAYLTESFKPMAVQKEEGIAWLKRHVGYGKGDVDVLINELEAMKVATAEEAAAFEATRVANKGQKATTKEGKAADAGGGNRVGKAQKAEPAVQAGKPGAKDLL